jgi:hypothetical protein
MNQPMLFPLPSSLTAQPALMLAPIVSMNPDVMRVQSANTSSFGPGFGLP